jgi:hypothetical protein
MLRKPDLIGLNLRHHVSSPSRGQLLVSVPLAMMFIRIRPFYRCIVSSMRMFLYSRAHNVKLDEKEQNE